MHVQFGSVVAVPGSSSAYPTPPWYSNSSHSKGISELSPQFWNFHDTIPPTLQKLLSMATVKGSIYFRVTGAPWEGSYEEAESALRKVILDNLTKKEQQGQQHHISILPSCDPEDQTCVALIEFRDGVPHFFSNLIQKPLADWQVEMRDTDITFDRHFFGFTQLYIPRGGGIRSRLSITETFYQFIGLS